MPAFLSLWAMCALALPRWQAHTVWPHVASRASGLIDRVRVRLMLFSPAITGTSNERHISSKFLDSEKGSARHGVMNGDLRSFPGLLVCINVALFTAMPSDAGMGVAFCPEVCPRYHCKCVSIRLERGGGGET